MHTLLESGRGNHLENSRDVAGAATLRRHGFTSWPMGSSKAKGRLQKWEAHGREAKIQMKVDEEACSSVNRDVGRYKRC